MTVEILPLSEICEVTAGGTPSRANEAFWGGDIPWVKISDMLQGQITWTAEAITPLGLQQSSAKLFPVGTLLLSIFATIGRTAILKIPAATNQAIAGLQVRDSDRVDSSYLRRYLEKLAPMLAGQARGVAQANINLSILRATEIPLPPLPEQRRVAAILDKADALRAKHRAAIAKLDQLLRSVFLRTMADAEQWPTEHLSDLCDERAPITYGILQPGPDVDDGILYVRPSEIKEGKIVVQSLRRTTPQIARRYAKSALIPGDILITIVGTIGSVAVVPESLSGANITQSSARIRISRDKAEPRFVELFLRSSLARKQYEKARLGVAVERLNLHHVRDLEVPLPPIAVQREVARAADKIERLHSLQASSLPRLDALFAALTQQLFRGGPM